MKKLLHGKILIIVSILAFITSFIAVIDGIINILDILKAGGISKDVIMTSSTVNLGVDLVFALSEIKFGYSLLQCIKKDEHYEAYKQIPGLIKAIIKPFFAFILVNIGFSILDSFTKDSEILTGPLMIMLVMYIIISLVSSRIRDAVLKRKLQTLNVVTIILSNLSLLYLGLIYKDVIYLDPLLSGISNILNIVVILLVLVFAIISLIYYIKHPDLLISDSREHEDSEVIKEAEKYNLLKIYYVRTQHPKMNKVSDILNVILGIISLAIGVYFFINTSLPYIKIFDLNTIVQGFKNLSLIFDTINYLYELLFNLMVPVILVTCGIGVISYAFTSDAKQRFGRLGIVQVGYILSLTFIITQILSLVFNFSNLSLKYFLDNYSIGDLLLLAPAIIFIVIGKYFNNSFADIQKGISNGDTYLEHIKPIHKLTVFYAFISSITVLGFIVKQDFKFDLSLYVLLFIHLFVVVISSLEKKYPCEEYVKVKRRK